MDDNPGFTVRRADHVGFSVLSLDGSLRFWVDGLGASVERTGEMGGDFLGEVTGAHGAHVRLAVVSLAGQTVELLEYRDAPGSPTSSRPFYPGFAHLAFEVDDIDAVLTRISGFGWTAQGTPQPIAGGAKAGTLVMYALGPDGETIEFMQPPRE
ncbi:glyoxalase [Rhodococcoides trifolii]|uniref:Glyoxalase n=1 Tax=Rhodococcoides trifolii TaxID=908250 RepID=A0A917CJN3_9NOCA|nr:VOC family protein [Rhodococcus trifolii]GGF90954.1 glyoxalase [Rhodococcus trifolii]